MQNLKNLNYFKATLQDHENVMQQNNSKSFPSSLYAMI